MIALTYELHCDVCSNIHYEGSTDMSPGAIPPWPVLPEGWRGWAHMIICDRHELTMIAKDGKETRQYRWLKTGEIVKD